MKLLDGVIFTGFSGDVTWESSKHPRDAHGHWSFATRGDAELKNLLQASASDPLARNAAADKLDDLGRSSEADLLRQHKHPVVAIGGGVFSTPGIPEEVGPQSLLILANRPARVRQSNRGQRGYANFKEQRGTYRMLMSSDDVTHAINAPGTNDPNYDHHDLMTRLHAHGRWQPRDPASEEKVNAILHRLMEHQLTGEAGSLLVLTPREEKVLATYHTRATPSGDPYRSPHRSSDLVDFNTQKQAIIDTLDSQLVLHEGGVMTNHPPSLRHHDYSRPPRQERDRRERILGAEVRGNDLEQAARTASPDGYLDWGNAAWVGHDVENYLKLRGFAAGETNSILAPSRRHIEHAKQVLPAIIRRSMQRRGYRVKEEE